MTSASPAAIGGASRVVGVDVARALALIGMIAAHSFETLDESGNPTLTHLVAGGRSAATFVLVSGVSLAFLSGGRTAVHGGERIGVAAGLAVRAVLIGGLGLALGLLSDLNGVEGILPVYGMLFLLAIPLLWCTPLVLVGVAAALIAVGPVLIVATANAGLPYAGIRSDPTFSTLIHDPVGLLVQLFLTGVYPAVAYLPFLCVGLVIGRLDLRYRPVGWWLVGGGLMLAVAARAISALLLYPMGGLARLIEAGGLDNDPEHVNALLWDESKPPTSWWYLALPAPHAYSPIDLLHTLGSAAAVLGAALLLTRIPVVARVLWPLAAAGSMALTLYSAHLVLLAAEVPDVQPALLFWAQVLAALALASAWRWRLRQGPLEALVTASATSTRRAVTNRLAKRRPVASNSSTWRVVHTAARAGAQVLGPVACAAVLALTFWAGARFAAPPAPTTPADLADTPLSDVSDGSDGSGAMSKRSDGSDARTETDAPGLAAEPAPPAAVPPASPADTPPAAAVAPTPDVDRYCELSEQLYALDEAHPDQPGVVVEKGAMQLDQLPQVAPVEIRDAVTAIVNDYLAEAGASGATAPEQGTLLRAEASVEAFEDVHC